MNLSKSVQDQIKRLQLSGSFHLNARQKKELADFNKSVGIRELVNFDCPTCVRDAMHAAGKYVKSLQKQPKLYKGAMVKDPENMKRPELMKACKDKGISFSRNATKKDLIKLLK